MHSLVSWFVDNGKPDWDAYSAVGTLLAVVVALILPMYTEWRERRKKAIEARENTQTILLRGQVALQTLTAIVVSRHTGNRAEFYRLVSLARSYADEMARYGGLAGVPATAVECATSINIALRMTQEASGYVMARRYGYAHFAMEAAISLGQNGFSTLASIPTNDETRGTIRRDQGAFDAAVSSWREMPVPDFAAAEFPKTDYSIWRAVVGKVRAKLNN